ncbi:SDR family NAD(P)-dependent oxidoreductase [Aestuariibacter halophilus]|uniref:SDR family NAD(P)-dependent oxidoreductase n=1 Tax=Fluctibacter halophilus TaxID=226011 RepID=A0ABS8G7P3_9ALTE|nr:SDR family NAD(P)-dependent oxidoreductase [Aestuariibacter halophilus]MCC2616604.1 SDR family NAD(P)-dependent oxidoreductase [Aestuariibacter halophilus]
MNTSWQLRFSGLVAVVTGAGSGMGRAYAQLLHEAGCNVVCVDNDALGLRHTQGLLGEESEAGCMIKPMDVSDPRAWSELAAEVAQQWGGAHVLINNAGIEGEVAPVWEIEPDTLERVMAVNFYGAVHGIRAFLPQLMAQPWSAIVNVSSIFGFVGAPTSADYCASKFALRGYTEALMVEMQQLGAGPQIHLVHPGGINTNINRKQASRAFRDKFLITDPMDIARHVLAAVAANRPRIVFGHQAKKTYWGSKLLPLRWIVRLMQREMQDVCDTAAFSTDHPGLKEKP